MITYPSSKVNNKTQFKFVCTNTDRLHISSLSVCDIWILYASIRYFWINLRILHFTVSYKLRKTQTTCKKQGNIFYSHSTEFTIVHMSVYIPCIQLIILRYPGEKILWNALYLWTFYYTNFCFWGYFTSFFSVN